MRIDPLLVHYPVRLREVTIGVILSLTFMFYFFPRFLGEGERTNFSFNNSLDIIYPGRLIIQKNLPTLIH